MQKQILVTIDKLGNPTIEAKGFAGQGCAAATEALEKALSSGDGKIDKTFKPEYNQGGSAQESEKIKNW